MSRLLLNRTSEIAPFIMSLAAFLLVLLTIPRSNRLVDTIHSDFLDEGRLEAVLASCWRSKLAAAVVALAFAPVRFFKL